MRAPEDLARLRHAAAADRAGPLVEPPLPARRARQQAKLDDVAGLDGVASRAFARSPTARRVRPGLRFVDRVSVRAHDLSISDG